MTFAPPEISVVVPCHNEADNLPALLDEVRTALDAIGRPWEMIVTDDCSTDASWSVLQSLAADEPRLRLQRFVANCGESAASWAGMQAARGALILTIDADLQNDPREIPTFLAALDGADCVCGSRVAARAEGDGVVKVLSSRIANGVRSRLGGGSISDAGCTYRVFRRDCIGNIRFFKGLHRFLPTLIEMDGWRVVEIPIVNRPRTAGASHYGIGNRVFAAFADLLAVRWMRSRNVRWRVRETIN